MRCGDGWLWAGVVGWPSSVTRLPAISGAEVIGYLFRGRHPRTAILVSRITQKTGSKCLPSAYQDACTVVTTASNAQEPPEEIPTELFEEWIKAEQDKLSDATQGTWPTRSPVEWAPSRLEPICTAEDVECRNAFLTSPNESPDVCGIFSPGWHLWGVQLSEIGHLVAHSKGESDHPVIQ